MSRPLSHALALTDRGPVHRHRWLPRCACGWLGVPRRRRTGAEAEYHKHVSGSERHGYHPLHRPVARPRAVTPVGLLPEVLRPAG